LAGTNTIKISYVSRPFIISAVISLFVGSLIGAAWMMTIFNISVPHWFGQLFQQHKILQIDGFLTLLIMGVGYMIVPRFRNVSLPYVKYAYLSFILVLISLIGQVVALLQLPILSNMFFIIIIAIITLRFVGISVFVTIIFLMLKIRPKRLRLSDYFIALSVLTLLTMNIIELVQMSGLMYSEEDIIMPTLAVSYPLIHIELWLLFPIIMIFGIEYKTLPSFLGFIRPRSMVGLSSVILISSCVITGLLAILFDAKLLILHLVFNMLFFASVVTFVLSIYAFGGFNNSHIITTIQGEKKIRYDLTVLHIKISFLLLLLGIFVAILFGINQGQHFGGYRFALYDIAIHTIAIGFIGITISVYLPLMLPPIIGKTVQFTNLNKIPLLLIVLSLGLRALGDIILAQSNSVPNFGSQFSSLLTVKILNLSLGLSGWLVVIAMVVFVITMHRSLK
jgi:hypothetical protein